MATVVKANEEMGERIGKYEKLTPSHYTLASIPLPQIIAQLPLLSDGPHEIYDLCELSFGDSSFMRIAM